MRYFMNTDKFIEMNNQKFDSKLGVITSQIALGDITTALRDKINELTEKLEKVNARKWKFKVGQVLAFEGLTFQVLELLDNNKYLYKVEKFDYNHTLKKAGFSVNRDICYFDTHDRVDLIESPSDYSAHLFRLLEEERNKKCF